MRHQANASLLVRNLHGEQLRAVVTGEHAFVVGLPQLLAEPRTAALALSPTGGDALLVQELASQPPLVPGTEQRAPEELRLLLWQGRRRRVVSLASHKPLPMETARLGRVFWWPTGGRALTTLSRRVPGMSPLYKPFLIDLDKGTLIDLFGESPRPGVPIHYPSPRHPFAVMHLLEGGETPKEGALLQVERDGKLIELGTSAQVEGFLDDGETLLLSGTDSKENEVLTALHVPSRTRTTVPPERHTLYRARRVRQDVAADAEGALPIRMVGRLAAEGTPLEAIAVVLEPTEKRGEPVLVQAGAEPGGIARDLSGIFYFIQGQLYTAPLTKHPRTAFLAERDEQERRLCLARAERLRILLQNYLLAHPSAWPPELDAIFERESRDYSLTQNPRTGRMGLRFESGDRLASLGGPGGRAVIFQDGKVTWEPG